MADAKSKGKPPGKPESSKAAKVEQIYPDEINVTRAAEIIGVRPERVKALVRDGRIPTGVKNSKGWWRFSEAAVTDWAKDRPSRRGRADGRLKYFTYLTDEEHAMLTKAVKGTEITFTRANKPKPKDVEDS